MEKKYGNNWVFFSIISVLLIFIDQFTKIIALNSLKPIGSTVFIQGVLNFTFVENRGVAFGMFSGQRWFILFSTFVITVGLLWYYATLPKTLEFSWVRKCILLIFAGAIGNMLDRVFRGYVVDFFEFGFFEFPVFNVADCYVVVGAFVLSFIIIFYIKEEDLEKIEKIEKTEKTENVENVENVEKGE